MSYPYPCMHVRKKVAHSMFMGVHSKYLVQLQPHQQTILLLMHWVDSKRDLLHIEVAANA